MFAAVRNFLYRHRHKFLIGGSLVGGIALLSRFAEYKLLKWHDAQTLSLIEKQKRRQHYEKTRETANATVLSLSNSLSKIVCDELDADCILLAIRNKSKNKLLYWEDLKLVGFARSLAVVYTSSLVGSFVHVHLMLLGSYTYADANPKGSGVLVNTEVQERYLNHLQTFVQEGLPAIYKNILKAVKYHVGSLPLNNPISLEVLEGILKDITLTLAGEQTQQNGISAKLNPWSQFVVTHGRSVPNNQEESVLNSITEELVDIVDSIDFELVFQSLLQNGLNYILDYVAGFYPQNDIASNEQSLLADELQESCSNNSHAISNGLTAFTTKSTIPLAKLIPIMSGLVHSSLSPAPGHLLQSTILNELLENYCFNVYEAFSVRL